VAFAYQQSGPVESVRALALEPYEFICHAFCTRREGVSTGFFNSLNVSLHVGDKIENVMKNQDIIAKAFGIAPQRFIMVNQVHGDKILILDDASDRADKYTSAAFDAMVTDRPGLALGIKTADCCPVFLVDTVRQVIGAVHAGWQGTALKIAAKTVDILRKRFASDPKDILAVVGPAIGPCCYEVDRRVYDAMARDSHQTSPFIPAESQGEKWLFNLPLANKLQVMEMGVPKANISSFPTCTACHKDIFFSHRGEKGKTGRQLNFIMLKKGQ
jgi:hypothetical protein